MLLSFLLWITKFLPIRRIGENGEYLHRYFVFRCKYFRIFIHRFLRSDLDKELHNHPWDKSYSLILSGSYTEERLKDGALVKTVCSPGKINKIEKTTFHKVTLNTSEVWTLFVAGKGDGSWGFLDLDSGNYTPYYLFFSGRPISGNQDIKDLD